LAIETIRQIEPVLQNKKQEMQQFQREYMDLKTRFFKKNNFLKFVSFLDGKRQKQSSKKKMKISQIYLKQGRKVMIGLFS